MKKRPPSGGNLEGHSQQNRQDTLSTEMFDGVQSVCMQAKRIRVLYVGRRYASIDEVEACLSERARAGVAGYQNGEARDEQVGENPGVDPIVHFTALTNQRVALRHIRSDPPELVLVEIDGKPNSRARFCEMLRYRLPTALIVAVGYEQPRGEVEFDGFIEMPLTGEKVLGVIENAPRTLTNHELVCGPIRLNVVRRTVYTPKGKHHMTPKQCALLQMLMENRNVVVNRSQIMEEIWKTSYLEDTRTLDVHIRWLREHIEPNPSTPIYLITVRGKGYMFSLPRD